MHKCTNACEHIPLTVGTSAGRRMGIFDHFNSFQIVENQKKKLDHLSSQIKVSFLLKH